MSVVPAADIPFVDAQISHASVASSSSPTAPQTPSRSSLGTETDAGSTAQNNYLVDLSRALNNLIARYADRAVVGKVNVDQHGDISMKYGVRNIPTILFLKNGEVVDKSVGAVPKNVLVEKLEALL